MRSTLGTLITAAQGIVEHFYHTGRTRAIFQAAAETGV
jgi:hypothetical protein